MKTYSLSPEGQMMPVADGCQPGEWLKLVDIQHEFRQLSEQIEGIEMILGAEIPLA